MAEFEPSANETEVDSEFQQKQNRSLEAFHKRGYFDYSDGGDIICDVDRIDKLLPQKNLFLHTIWGKANYSAVQDTFRGIPVISRHDWDNGERKAKPLFYEPKSDQDALSIESIRESDFYLNPAKSSRPSVRFFNLQNVSTAEASIALLTYHQKFGDGYRDPATGQLRFRGQDRKYRNFSAEALTHNYPLRGGEKSSPEGKKVSLHINPRRYIETQCPNLARSGLIRPDDLRQRVKVTGPLTSNVSRNGSLFIRGTGMRYFIGKEFRGSPVTTVGRYAIITQGENDNITHFFRTRPELRQPNKPLTTLTSKDVKLQPFERDRFIQRFPEESDEEYQARISAFEAFESKRLTEIAFKKYPEILKAADSIRSFLRDNFEGDQNYSEATANKIVSNMLRRCREIISQADIGSQNISDINNEIANISTSLILFASTFKILKAQGESVRLEDFKDYHLDVLPADQIEEADRDEMTRILTQNWRAQDPKIAPYALKSFQDSLNHPHSRFYILRFRDQIAGFKRFDTLVDNDLYAASLNINPAIQNHKIGEAALQVYLDREAKEHRIYADASLDTRITQRYIGGFGFVGTAVIKKEIEGEEFPLLHMMRDDKVNPRFEYLKNHERAIDSYTSNEYNPTQDQIILRFDDPEEAKTEMATILNRGNHFLTAFFTHGAQTYLAFEAAK